MTHKNINKNQQGRLMLEILAFLAMVGMISPMLLRRNLEKNIELEDSIIASQMKSLQQSTTNFIANNYIEIVKGETVGGQSFTASEGATGDVIIELSQDNDAFSPYLPDGFNEKGIIGNKFKIYIKKEGNDEAPPVSALIVGNKVSKTAISNTRGSRISSLIGISGGYVPTNFGNQSKTTAIGNEGLWALDTKDYIPDVGASEGSIVTTTVVIGEVAQSENPNIGGNFLWRKQSTDPAHNKIDANLSLGSYDVKWLKDIISFKEYENQFIAAPASTTPFDGNVRKGDTRKLDAAGEPIDENFNLSLEEESLVHDVVLGTYGENKISKLMPELSLKRIVEVESGSKEIEAPGYEPSPDTGTKCPIGYAPVIMLIPNIEDSTDSFTPLVSQINSGDETTGWDVTFSSKGGDAYVYCKFVKASFTGLTSESTPSTP